MKKTRLKRRSDSEIAKVQKALWKECRRIVFNRDNKDGRIDCYTCPAKDIQGVNRQLGHGPWPDSVCGAFLRYDLRCLHYQCYNCNLNHGGMGHEYGQHLLRDHGPEWMKQLEKDKNKIVKAQDHYEKLLKEYKEIE